MTKAFFVAGKREALMSLGLNPKEYVGHSFCIGIAAQAGLEDSVIQVLGRWNSAAFLRSIRTSQERLGSYSRELAVSAERVYTCRFCVHHRLYCMRIE